MAWSAPASFLATRPIHSTPCLLPTVNQHLFASISVFVPAEVCLLGIQHGLSCLALMVHLLPPLARAPTFLLLLARSPTCHNTTHQHPASDRTTFARHSFPTIAPVIRWFLIADAVYRIATRDDHSCTLLRWMPRFNIFLYSKDFAADALVMFFFVSHSGNGIPHTDVLAMTDLTESNKRPHSCNQRVCQSQTITVQCRTHHALSENMCAFPTQMVQLVHLSVHPHRFVIVVCSTPKIVPI